ncbi:hypothetical protein D3C72_1554310 [compost metagenome]
MSDVGAQGAASTSTRKVGLAPPAPDRWPNTRPLAISAPVTPLLSVVVAMPGAFCVKSSPSSPAPEPPVNVVL